MKKGAGGSVCSKGQGVEHAQLLRREIKAVA